MSLVIDALGIGLIGLVALLVVLILLIFRERGEDRLAHQTFVGLAILIYFLLLMIPFGAASSGHGLSLVMILNVYWSVSYYVLWWSWFGGGRI